MEDLAPQSATAKLFCTPSKSYERFIRAAKHKSTPPPPPNPFSDAFEAVAGVLEALLLDAVAEGSTVHRSLSSLETEATPIFAEIRSAPGPDAGSAPSLADASVPALPQPPPEYRNADGGSVSDGAGGAQAGQPTEGLEGPSEGSTRGSVPEGGLGGVREGGLVWGEEELVRAPEVQALAEFVLDSAVLGLVQASLAGEWGSPA